MEIVLIIFNVVLALLFIGLGVAFRKGKNSPLVEGYNTSSKEEKGKTDKDALLRCMSNTMFVLVFSNVIWIVGIITQKEILEPVGAVWFLVVAIFAVVYMCVSPKFKK